MNWNGEIRRADSVNRTRVQLSPRRCTNPLVDASPNESQLVSLERQVCGHVVFECHSAKTVAWAPSFLPAPSYKQNVYTHRIRNTARALVSKWQLSPLSSPMPSGNDSGDCAQKLTLWATPYCFCSLIKSTPRLSMAMLMFGSKIGINFREKIGFESGMLFFHQLDSKSWRQDRKWFRDNCLQRNCAVA